MKAIITYPNPDGTYDEVGTRNKWLTSHYKTERGLLRYAVQGRPARIEYFTNIFADPYKVSYVNGAKP